MEEKKPHFAIQRIFLKNLSMECPNSPEIFKNWNPELSVDLKTAHRHLEEDFWEASIRITATVKCTEQVAFVCEVDQAGIFTLSNVPADQVEQLLETVGMEAIYPFAREVIADVVVKSGFHQLLLAPINFDAYYQEKKKQK